LYGCHDNDQLNLLCWD